MALTTDGFYAVHRRAPCPDPLSNGPRRKEFRWGGSYRYWKWKTARFSSIGRSVSGSFRAIQMFGVIGT
jgi:hypothetical protein